jgi:hypothetical protein
MLAATGLRLERVYSGFDGEVYGVDTRRMTEDFCRFGTRRLGVSRKRFR